MYPRISIRPRLPARSVCKQKGFLIPMALFIVVGLGVLALAISRMGSGTQSVSIRESISVQALFAAESGSQYAMNQLLFDASNRGEVDGRCTTVNGNSLSFTAVGLTGCSATISCQRLVNTGGQARVYQVQTTATCGGGDLTAERIVSVKASFE